VNANSLTKERVTRPVEQEPLLIARGVSKKFGNVVALENVDIEVGHNEIVGLLGDNGAGKSTLVKILMGFHQADAGEIFFRGKKVDFRSPEDARTSGIEIVYQDSNLVGTMSTWRNFFIGKEPTKRLFGFLPILDIKKMKKDTQENLTKLGITLKSNDAYVSVLSGGQQQSLAVVRALYFGAKLLIMDEPTTALSVRATERVIEFIRSLKSMGVSVLFITHNMYHAYDVCDRFEILEQGHKIASLTKDECTGAEQIMDIIRREKAHVS
jgi:simple sugar transport system ATP-binding protein